MNKKYDIIIVGGGASGLTAAIAAKTECPALTVAVTERLNRVGKKLLTTGNGCCNITNSDMDICHFHSADIKYFDAVYSQFDRNKTLRFFEELGVPTVSSDSGKMYPRSKTAASVLNALRFRAEYLGVDILTETEITNAFQSDGGFCVISDSGKFECEKLIIAAGGKAQKKLGSNGSGYKLLQGFGHTMTAIFPSIVQLTCDSSKTSPMSGIKVIGNITLFADDVPVANESGEILFTNYGLSGPPVLLISRKVNEYSGSRLEVSIDLLPTLSEADILDLLYAMRLNIAYLGMEDFLSGVINKRVGNAVTKSAGISPLSRPACSLSDIEIDRLAHKLKDYRIGGIGVMGFENAQVTAGGIRLSEFDPHTLMSKKADGLYACGEVLDLDGDCGGYNLQWAWSSGYVAGKNSAK